MDITKNKNVEQRLIEATKHLVCSTGPKKISTREIANCAGVNHAQIHHYFGGKAKLLEETYKQLAIEHVEQFKNKNISINNLGNQPLSSGLINNYYQAIIRAVLDGELDLAKLQVESNLSMSKELLSQLAASKNLDEPTPEMKSAIALGLVIEFESKIAAKKAFYSEVFQNYIRSRNINELVTISSL